MSNENQNACQGAKCVCELVGRERLEREFLRLRSDWYWFALYGLLLVVSGTVAIIVPPLAAVAAMIVLGAALLVCGTATIVLAFWAGRWTGVLVHLLVGILYVIAGFAIFDMPVGAGLNATLFVAVFFIVVGIFRALAALLIRFPHWGWSLLNGLVTFLLGAVIYRQFSHGHIWILGLLIGLELLFHGWTWIMLALAVRNIPEKAAA
jgi:uncharacterized membrane protein HdeD (DUF308 family)